jgi:hypothetical protein
MLELAQHSDPREKPLAILLLGKFTPPAVRREAALAHHQTLQ